MAYKQGTIIKRGKIWHTQIYVKGKPSMKTTGQGDRDVALDKLKERKEEAKKLRRSQGKAPTLGEGLDALLKLYAKKDRSSTYDVTMRIAKHVRPKLGKIRMDRLEDVIDDYIEQRLESARPATINRELSAIRTAGKILMKDAAPKIPKLDEDNARQGFLEFDMYEKLRGKLPRHLQCPFVVAYHVGTRRGELLKILIDQVDLENKEIALDRKTTKSGVGRTLPIYGEMAAWLEMQIEWVKDKYPGCKWLFPYRGKRMLSISQGGWKTAVEAAGCKGLLFHDLRRSAVRNMERAALPRSVAMKISGHKTESIYQRYDIVSKKDISLAAERMENFLTAAKTAAIEEKRKNSEKEGKQRRQ